MPTVPRHWTSMTGNLMLSWIALSTERSGLRLPKEGSFAFGRLPSASRYSWWQSFTSWQKQLPSAEKKRLYYVLLMLCLCDCITTGREQQGTRESQLIKCTLFCQGVSSSDFLRHACEIGIIQHDTSHASSPSIIEFIWICFILLKLNVALR